LIREAGQLPLWADSPLKDTDFRISQGGILIGRNQVLVRDAVIVEKNEKLRGRVCGSTISIGGRASPWSLDHLHAGQFPSQHLPGLQRVSVIADDDRTIRVSNDIRNDPAEAPHKKLMPIPGGDDNRNAGQGHKDNPIQDQMIVKTADLDLQTQGRVLCRLVFPSPDGDQQD
jgi:hypothetical protein